MDSESTTSAPSSEVIGDYHDKEGLVIDIRYNKGGNIHDQLITLFTGEVNAGFTTRDGRVAAACPPAAGPSPPRCCKTPAPTPMAASSRTSTSGGLGPIVGDRVPGTGTAVWWMYPINALKWGIPQLGAKDFKTGWFENSEIVPDIPVYNTPEDVAAGRDPQLEAAIHRLLQDLSSVKKGN